GVRRLHGPPGRSAREELSRAGGAGPGLAADHGGGAGRTGWQPSSDPAGVYGQPRASVWVLYPGYSHGNPGVPRGRRRPRRGGEQGDALRQPLPVHRVSLHRRGGEGVGAGPVTIYAEPRLLPCGDGAVSVELADEIGRLVSARVLALDYLLGQEKSPG